MWSQETYDILWSFENIKLSLVFHEKIKCDVSDYCITGAST